jgi:hypothetical protein
MLQLFLCNGLRPSSGGACHLVLTPRPHLSRGCFLTRPEALAVCQRSSEEDSRRAPAVSQVVGVWQGPVRYGEALAIRSPFSKERFLALHNSGEVRSTGHGGIPISCPAFRARIDSTLSCLVMMVVCHHSTADGSRRQGCPFRTRTIVGATYDWTALRRMPRAYRWAIGVACWARPRSGFS